MWWGDHLIMRQFGLIPAWSLKEKKLSPCYQKAEEGKYKKRFCCCYYYCLLLCRLWQQIKGATSQVEGHSWRGSTRRARATLNVTGPSCYITGHPSGDPTGTNRSIFKCPLTNSLSHSLSSSHGLKPETQRNPSFLIGIRCSIMAVTATRKLTHLTIPRPRNLFV